MCWHGADLDRVEKVMAGRAVRIVMVLVRYVIFDALWT